jgi:hypothetical protein
MTRHPPIVLREGFLILSAFAALATACGGGSSGSNPTGPSSPSSSTPAPSPAACRTYATSLRLETVVLDDAGREVQRLTGNGSSMFNRATATVSGNSTHTYTVGGASCTATNSSTAAYASVADFVDENKPPGRRLVRTITGSGSVTGPPSSCGSAPGTSAPTTTTLNYDAQGRLLSDGGYTYSAWDSFGRPTMGTAPPPQGYTCGSGSVSISYNDAARTMTSSLRFDSCVTGPRTITTIVEFDSDVIEVRSRTTTAGSAASTTATITPLATAQVCK